MKKVTGYELMEIISNLYNKSIKKENRYEFFTLTILGMFLLSILLAVGFNTLYEVEDRKFVIDVFLISFITGVFLLSRFWFRKEKTDEENNENIILANFNGISLKDIKLLQKTSNELLQDECLNDFSFDMIKKMFIVKFHNHKKEFIEDLKKVKDFEKNNIDSGVDDAIKYLSKYKVNSKYVNNGIVNKKYKAFFINLFNRDYVSTPDLVAFSLLFIMIISLPLFGLIKSKGYDLNTFIPLILGLNILISTAFSFIISNKLSYLSRQEKINTDNVFSDFDFEDKMPLAMKTSKYILDEQIYDELNNSGKFYLFNKKYKEFLEEDIAKDKACVENQKELLKQYKELNEITISKD